MELLQRHLRRSHSQKPTTWPVTTGHLTTVVEAGRALSAKTSVGLAELIAAENWGQIALDVTVRSNARPRTDGTHDKLLSELGVLRCHVAHLHSANINSERVRHEAVTRAQREICQRQHSEQADVTNVLFTVSRDAIKAAGVTEQVSFAAAATETSWVLSGQQVTIGPVWLYSYLRSKLTGSATSAECHTAPDSQELVEAVRALVDQGMSFSEAAEVISAVM